MNKQGPNGISWTDFTWNPVKGMCPMGCWYCYARAMYKRLDLMERMFGEMPNRDFELTDDTFILDEKELEEPARKRGNLKIFVCSTFELFHPAADEFRDDVFRVIRDNPQHTFQILTKMPERIDREMPDNVWLGVTMTGPGDLLRWKELQKHRATVRFISAEPLLEPYSISAPFPDWLIIGRLTGHGGKYDPSRNSLIYIYSDCRRENTPLFMKHSLKDIWGDQLIQEFPEQP